MSVHYSKTFSKVFKDTINDIENNEQESSPRGLKVKENLLATLPINPLYPIANFSDRTFNWKYFAGELAWYLRKDRDINYINNFSSFWKNITNPGTNEINSNYGSLVLNEQLEWVIESLIKDKNSRQAIAFFNRPQFQFEGNKDFVCTMYANFFIRNNKLHMKIQMRSNDIFYGLTFDAPFFSFLHQTVYHAVWKERVLNGNDDILELGTYYHCADNIHFYERHFELANKIKNADNKFEEYSLKLRNTFIEYTEEGLQLTEAAKDFIDDVDFSIEGKVKTDQEYYKGLIAKYFYLKL
jgi:thymidylate synthase